MTAIYVPIATSISCSCHKILVFYSAIKPQFKLLHRYLAHSRQRELENLVLRHLVLHFPPSSLNPELNVALLPCYQIERNENIKYLITSSGNETHDHRAYSHMFVLLRDDDLIVFLISFFLFSAVQQQSLLIFFS